MHAFFFLLLTNSGLELAAAGHARAGGGAVVLQLGHSRRQRRPAHAVHHTVPPLPVERPRFGAALGEALLAGALKPANRGGGGGGELPRALEDMEGVLQRLRDGGVIASFELSGGQRDRVAEEWEDAPPGASVGWTYLVSGCVLSRVSQLAEARAATLSPAQLVTAPLAAVLAATRGVEQPLVALYFIDPRGRPDPRTFSDPTFYTQLLLEVTARKGG